MTITINGVECTEGTDYTIQGNTIFFKEKLPDKEVDVSRNISLQDLVTKVRVHKARAIKEQQFELADSFRDIEKDLRWLGEDSELWRMRLAACSTVALANTPASAKEARKMAPQYESATLQDVAKAIDREMSLRAALKQAVEIGRLTLSANGINILVENGEGHAPSEDNKELAHHINKIKFDGTYQW